MGRAARGGKKREEGRKESGRPKKEKEREFKCYPNAFEFEFEV
jgi:hypothetical protein